MENYIVPNPGQVSQPHMWVDEFGDFLFRYAVSRLRDVNSAEDVVQQTFLAGLKHFDQYSGKGSMEFWPIFRQCLEGLPPRQADVFALREMDDLSTEVICKELSISPSNLWTQLHRARLRLAICIKTRWNQDHS